MAETTFYVQLKPTFRGRDRQTLDTVRAVAVTQSRPMAPRGRGGTVVIKLRVNVPDAAFFPLTPEAVIEFSLDETVVMVAEAMEPDPVEADE